jgi:pimeloyl-ACP methyl ester carboxylesterase
MLRRTLSIALAMAVAVPLAAFVAGPLAGSAAAASEPYACRADRQAVALAAGSTSVPTWLCAEGPAEGKPLLIAVPGTTYTHTYWDWDQDPGRYSFARSLAGAGYAVLLYDRTGTGAADLPPAATVTLDLHARVLHALVQRARSEGHPSVATVGHSQGSLVVMQEAARYHDVDAIVVTGMLHAPMNPTGAAIVAGSFAWPAQLDPRFAEVPLGYTTTIPGIRGPAFYGPTADPAVIAHDEATKSVTAPIELATALPALVLAPPSIDVPVLDVIGQYDGAFCPPVIGCGNPLLPDPIDVEPLTWPNVPRMDTFVLPGSGHDLNLHPNAARWFAAARSFLDAALRP